MSQFGRALSRSHRAAVALEIEQRKWAVEPPEPKGDGITDDTDAIQRGSAWLKRGKPYTPPTQEPPPEDRKVKDG